MKKTLLAAAFLIVLMIAASAYFFSLLPDKIISHWGINSEPNGWMPKLDFFVFFICLAIALFLLLTFLPRFDPLKKNYAHFQKEYDLLVLIFSGFMLYIFLISILANLGSKLNIGLMLLPALAVLFYFIGMLMQKTKRNWFVGIRTPWTLSSDSVWEKTHRLGAKIFKALAILLLLTGIFSSFFGDIAMQWLFPIVFAEILFFAFSTVVFSYVFYAEEKKQGSKPSGKKPAH